MQSHNTFNMDLGIKGTRCRTLKNNKTLGYNPQALLIANSILFLMLWDRKINCEFEFPLCSLNYLALLFISFFLLRYLYQCYFGCCNPRHLDQIVDFCHFLSIHPYDSFEFSEIYQSLDLPFYFLFSSLHYSIFNIYNGFILIQLSRKELLYVTKSITSQMLTEIYLKILDLLKDIGPNEFDNK